MCYIAAMRIQFFIIAVLLSLMVWTGIVRIGVATYHAAMQDHRTIAAIDDPEPEV